ncbi:GTP cyclohydrolase [Flagellimonas sp. S174]|uniref:GTP cyclohydrolase n=1 Tax=Flagellimonas sp. S174 TaxID=3410790 RepID=UPI003BF49108
MKTIETLKNVRLLAILFLSVMVVSCSDDDDAPEEEEELEVITSVTLQFTNNADPMDVITATAIDPDGEGITPLQVQGGIALAADTQYTLTFVILNALDPDDVEDIGEEILDEDDEHQFFFSFTDGAFDSPTGTGNIAPATGAINYNDTDDNGNPVGLSTNWTTAATGTTMGTFTARLQHQPPVNDTAVKTATSTSEDGDADFNLTFDLTIQ